jgi:hypothetical protein
MEEKVSIMISRAMAEEIVGGKRLFERFMKKYERMPVFEGVIAELYTNAHLALRMSGKSRTFFLIGTLWSNIDRIVDASGRVRKNLIRTPWRQR